MGSKVFITGATGFIGSNLVKKLIMGENQIYALTRSSDTVLDNKINIVRGDLNDFKSYSRTLESCEQLFHCAAYISFSKRDFVKAHHVNVEGTRQLLEVAHRAGVKKVVHLSACAVLGYSNDRDTIIDETADPKITEDNAYAYTKKLAEDAVRSYAAKGLDVSIANIATVYGRGDRKLNSGSIINSIYSGKLKVIPPGGTSYVAVDDLIEGLILVAEKGRPGERYIFSSQNLTYRELIERIARVVGVAAPTMALPASSYYPALLAANIMEFCTRLSNNTVNLVTSQLLKEAYGYKYYCSDKARKELGWKPVQTLEEAVDKAFRYYKAHSLI